MVRNKLFDWHILPSREFAVPVIAVGNITVGGTGKTPHVEYLIKLLNASKIAVLSRGYGRKTMGYRLVSENDVARLVGDEPLQIKRKFTHLTVAVCEKRVVGIENLLSDTTAPNAIILDDAFQHRHVKPSFSLALMNYHEPVYHDWVLPTGRLREPLTGLKRSNAIVVTKCPVDLSIQEKEKIATRLNRVSEKPIFFSYFKYGNLQQVFSNQIRALTQNLPVFMVTGIANPTPLRNYLKNQLLGEMTFPDHYAFTQKDIQHMIRTFRNIEMDHKILLTTEKDAQRFRHFHSLFKEISDSFYFIPIEVGFLFNAEDKFKQLIVNHINKGKLQ